MVGGERGTGNGTNRPDNRLYESHPWDSPKGSFAAPFFSRKIGAQLQAAQRGSVKGGPSETPDK